MKRLDRIAGDLDNNIRHSKQLNRDFYLETRHYLVTCHILFVYCTVLYKIILFMGMGIFLIYFTCLVTRYSDVEVDPYPRAGDPARCRNFFSAMNVSLRGPSHVTKNMRWAP